MSATDATGSLRRSFYLLLTAVAVAVTLAKVVGAEMVYEPSRYKPPTETSYGADRDKNFVPKRAWPAVRPEPTLMFSSNDRSRWATVKALVENGTFVIGQRDNFRDESDYRDSGIIFQDGYQSLDKVMNPETGQFYSSKPPVLPIIVAGEYYVLHKFLGLSIDHNRWWVVGIILITVNVLPFALYLVLLAKLIEEHGTTDFGRLFTFTVACCATFLTTFSMTLNNHSPAAYCALFAIYPLLRADADDSAFSLLVSGFFAGLTTTFELPAAAFAVGLFVLLAISRPSRAMLCFLPGMAVPIVGLFASNYAAMGLWLPAYGEFGGPWYNFAGSHWANLGKLTATGIDFADEPKSVYAFHLLVGHHGWFSLTPVWLLAAGGLIGNAVPSFSDITKLLTSPKAGSRGIWTSAMMSALTVAVSVVVFGFYVWKTNNYGGFTCCARWLIWLTPLWLLGTLHATDRLARIAAARWIAGVLLGVSIFSVYYPAWNPWRAPWILQLCEVNGWVRY